jgi:hypothetical protein
MERVGFVPMSILKLSRGKLSQQVYNLAQERRGRSIGSKDAQTRIDEFVTEEGKQTARERRDLGVFGGILAASGTNKSALSVMPAELVEFVLRYYSTPGETYLDPFIGQGVQAQTAGLLGWNYIGTDVCGEFVEFTRQSVSKLVARSAITTSVVVHHADARDIATLVDDDSCDVSFTSPPYWDVEFYDDDPRQLGTGHSYAEFIESMRDVYAAMLPKFRSGAFVVVNINDIRRGGVFYPYHSDLAAAISSVGYIMHDIWIIDGLVGGLPRAFGVDFNLKRIAPKTHEYLLVFKTP